MTREVELVAMYAEDRLDALADVLIAATAGDWRPVSEGGEYEYVRDGESCSASSLEEMLDALSGPHSGGVTLDNGGFTVTVLDEDPPIPETPSGITCVTVFCQAVALNLNAIGEQARTNVERYLSLVKRVVEATEPAYVFATLGPVDDPARVPSRSQLQSGRIPWVYWLNVFGPQTIDRLGRDRLHAAPAWRVSDVGEDHLLLVTRDSPVGYTAEWKYGPERTMTFLSESDKETTWRNEDGEWHEEEVTTWLFKPHGNNRSTSG